MSLDWDVSKVKNYKERCWRPSPLPGDKGKGRVVLTPETEALVWGAYYCDLGGIRKANVDEWDFRIRYMKECGISWVTLWDGERDIEIYPTREQIIEHIGLGTNVATMTRRRWLSKITKGVERKILHDMEIEAKQREKENDNA